MIDDDEGSEGARCGGVVHGSRARVPRGVVPALLAVPVVLPPIVNAELFTTPPAETILEIAGNYVPAVAIVVVLLGVYRWVMPSPARAATRFGVEVACCGAGAALASVLVHPFHACEVALVVYLQRNVGVTCLVVAAALLLQRGRARVDAAEREQRAAHQAARRAQLASRTQPHFLFNVLSTIASLVRDDPALAERTIVRLSDLLRYALDSAQRATVPLARELEVVESYLEIQQARFGARLRFELTVEPGVGARPIAPFLVHPLVENAVLHAVATRRQGATVRVAVATQRADLEIRVDDDGPGPGRSPHRGTGTSLADLRRRLALVYGERASFETSANPAGGFSAWLRIPLVVAAA